MLIDTRAASFALPLRWSDENSSNFVLPGPHTDHLVLVQHRETGEISHKICKIAAESSDLKICSTSTLMATTWIRQGQTIALLLERAVCVVDVQSMSCLAMLPLRFSTDAAATCIAFHQDTLFV